MTSAISSSQLREYFMSIGLQDIEQPTQQEEHVNIVQHVMQQTPPTSFTDEELIKLWSYRIPEVSEDGSCSLVEQLQPEPFNLACHLYGIKKISASEIPHNASVAQWRLNEIMGRLSELTQVDWLGVYSRFTHQAGADDGLVKLAYRGEPSRPIFPINEEFLAKSSNSLTAHHNRARVITDTRSKSNDTPYYECDHKVRSESCLPIIDPTTGRNLGIIDAESWKPAHANSDRVMWEIGRVCCELANTGLIIVHQSIKQSNSMSSTS